MATQSGEDSVLEFNPKLPKLSANEKKVLDLLVEAAKLIAPIYAEQEKLAKERDNLHPLEVWREIIQKAAKEDPATLSPYTVIEKVEGKIVATPYHIKYKELLKPVADKLEEAANLSENEGFAEALKIQAQALLDGAYDHANAAWLKVKPYVLNIAIGPVDHFDDKLFFGKASYQAWVGTLDTDGTDRLNNYMSVTLSSRRNTMMPRDQIEPKMIKAEVLDVILFSGFMARTKFTGVNLPIDVNFVEKYGAHVTLFNQPNDLRVEEQILPTFNKIFSEGFKKGFNEEDLRRGYLRSVALHELTHSYLYYRNSVKNLQSLFPVIYELAATILGLRLAGSLLLKDRITEKQLESMIVAFVSRSFYLAEKNKDAQPLINYALGGIVFINFMSESGALKQSDNKVFINFTKIFVSLHELSYILENLLAYGTKMAAEAFIRRYTHTSFLELLVN